MSDDLVCFRAGPDTVARVYQLAAQRGVDLDGLLPVLLDKAQGRDGWEGSARTPLQQLQYRLQELLELGLPGRIWDERVRALLGATDTALDITDDECPGPVPGHGCDHCRSDRELHPERFQ